MPLKMIINFDMDNSAFEEESPEYKGQLNFHEINRVLNEIGKKVFAGETYGGVFDYNGNNVGEWEIEK